MKQMLSLVLAFFLAASAFAQSPEELLQAARDAYRSGKINEAIQLTDKAIKANPKNLGALSLRATAYEHLDKYAEAVADWSKIIDLEKDAAQAYQNRGLVHFKQGKIKESISDFDAYIARKPDAKISHWQRGISYYYAGRFDDGRKQFEGYQDFDSNDVENAVWRFMCMVRVDGIDKARKAILKIGDDRRVPMRQVYDLYKGDLNPEDVLEATRAGDPKPDDLSRRLFYAHLYVGIYHDLLGNRQKAFEHLNTATEKHRVNHYMWDVARIHRDLLKKDQK